MCRQIYCISYGIAVFYELNLYTMNTSKVTNVLFFLLTISGLSMAQQDEPYQVKKFPVGNNAIVNVETVGGNIEVIGQATNEAKVEMYVRHNNWNDKLSKEELEERLQ